MNILQDITFFKEMGDLTKVDYRELAASFQLKEVEQKRNVFLYEDEGDFFYVILSGRVGVLIPNPLIKYWSQKRVMLGNLMDWKKKSFDRRVEDAMKKHLQA